MTPHGAWGRRGFACQLRDPSDVARSLRRRQSQCLAPAGGRGAAHDGCQLPAPVCSPAPADTPFTGHDSVAPQWRRARTTNPRPFWGQPYVGRLASALRLRFETSAGRAEAYRSSGQSPRASLLGPIRLGPRTRQRARPAQLRGRLARKIPEPQILNVLGSLDPPSNCHVCALRPPSPRQGSTTTPIALARHELLDVSCRYQLRWWRSKIGNRRAGG
jgi:hypothetical protein